MTDRLRRPCQLYYYYILMGKQIFIQLDSQLTYQLMNFQQIYNSRIVYIRIMSTVVTQFYIPKFFPDFNFL